jgi:hypothetical protein
MFLFLAMTQAIGGVPIPPPRPPRPTPEQIRAAKTLFSADPNESVNSWGINIAAAQIGGDALRARNLYTRDRDFALSARLEKIAKAEEAEIIDSAITCVAMRYATRLQVPDLEALRTFIGTSAGREFWRLNQDVENWRSCFRYPTEQHLGPRLDAEVDAVAKQHPKVE